MTDDTTAAPLPPCASLTGETPIGPVYYRSGAPVERPYPPGSRWVAVFSRRCGDAESDTMAHAKGRRRAADARRARRNALVELREVAARHDSDAAQAAIRFMADGAEPDTRTSDGT